MTSVAEPADLSDGAPLSRADQFVRRLLWIYGAFVLAIGLVLVLAVLPARAGLEKLKGLGAEALGGGLGVVALVFALLALFAVAAAALLTSARLYRRRVEAALLEGELDTGPPSLMTPIWRLEPGVLARQGQAALLTFGFVVIAALARILWPPLAVPPVQADANLVAAGVVGLAFISLVAERMTAAFPAAQLPEAPSLRRLILLTTLALAITGVLEIGRGAGFDWTVWLQRALAIAAAVVAAELALRALGRLFLPPPSAASATAAVDSILATLVTGGPRAPAMLIRTHLGLDFARSWALRYLSAAALPALGGTLVFCWLLSGVKLLSGDQRGIYERLGAPAGVIGPGLHVLLPWPLGRLRPVEYGTIHSLAVGVDVAPAIAADAGEGISAEAIPPASLNRLWDTAHPTEAEYLVASQTEGQQGLVQAVSAEIRVLYRTGLSQAAAWQSVYGAADQAAVVRQEASRLATRYFSSHTLDEVMGGRRDSLQAELRNELARAVAADHAGVDVVAVLVEAIHPPAGAAAAYHAVQAAEINADASVANATAHAERTAGEAQEEAQQAIDAAQAAAVEKVQGATGDAYAFGSDLKAYRQSPAAFLQERRDRALAQGLAGTRLTLVDSRLNASQGPVIDLRGARGGGAAPAPVAAAAAAVTPENMDRFVSDQPTPSTSSEGPAPPPTSEDAAERAPGAP